MRLDKTPDKPREELLRMLEALPPGLQWTPNMGHMDVFPATSGKQAVARYIMGRLRTQSELSFLLCDDANDMGTCGVGMLGARGS